MMESYIGYVAAPCLVVLGVALLLGCFRLFRGPDVADRVASVDLMTLTLVGMAIVKAVETRQAMWMDVGIVALVIGVLGSVAIARYMVRR